MNLIWIYCHKKIILSSNYILSYEQKYLTFIIIILKVIHLITNDKITIQNYTNNVLKLISKIIPLNWHQQKLTLRSFAVTEKKKRQRRICDIQELTKKESDKFKRNEEYSNGSVYVMSRKISQLQIGLSCPVPHRGHLLFVKTDHGSDMNLFYIKFEHSTQINASLTPKSWPSGTRQSFISDKL